MNCQWFHVYLTNMWVRTILVTPPGKDWIVFRVQDDFDPSADKTKTEENIKQLCLFSTLHTDRCGLKCSMEANNKTEGTVGLKRLETNAHGKSKWQMSCLVEFFFFPHLLYSDLSSPGQRPPWSESLHGKWRVGDEGFPQLEALGVLLVLPRHSLPGHHLPLPHAAAPTVLHRQRHHPLHALLLPHRPGLLPSHRLWYDDKLNT